MPRKKKDAVVATLEPETPAPVAPITPVTPTPARLVLWKNVLPSGLNPRKHFDQAKLEELAASIEEKGILQNLIVRPFAAETFEIAAGERRWRAVDWLYEQGRIADDYLIPVVVRDLTDRELLELAVSENVQRQDMHPLEEAEGYAALHAVGATAEEIALRVGKSRATVDKRIAMATRLSERAKELLRENRMNLEQAQALTLGTPEQQDAMLKPALKAHALIGWEWGPSHIRSMLSKAKVDAKLAIFSLEQYPQDKIHHDLFTGEVLLEDAAEFKRLQLEAIEAKKTKMEKTRAFVDVVHGTGYYHPSYQEYRSCTKKDKGAGSIIYFDTHSGAVKILEYFKRAPKEKQREATKPEKQKPEWSKSTLQTARLAKTHALQAKLVTDERSCLIVAILGLMNADGVKFGLQYEPLKDWEASSPALEQLVAPYRERIGQGVRLDQPNRKSLLPINAGYGNPTSVTAYHILREYDLEALRQLHQALVAARVAVFGMSNWEVTFHDHPLGAALAHDLGSSASDVWTLDEASLKQMSREKVEEIARELGITHKAGDSRKNLIAAILAAPEKLKGYLPEPFKPQVKASSTGFGTDALDPHPGYRPATDEDEVTDENVCEHCDTSVKEIREAGGTMWFTTDKDAELVCSECIEQEERDARHDEEFDDGDEITAGDPSDALLEDEDE